MKVLVFRTASGEEVKVTDAQQQENFITALMARRNGHLVEFKAGYKSYFNTCIESHYFQGDEKVNNYDKIKLDQKDKIKIKRPGWTAERRKKFMHTIKRRLAV